MMKDGGWLMDDGIHTRRAAVLECGRVDGIPVPVHMRSQLDREGRRTTEVVAKAKYSKAPIQRSCMR